MRSALYPILLADPMPWAAKAPYAWDFLRDRARFAGSSLSALASTPNWTYTRAGAQTAYAQTSAGVLTPFATGVLRRTDKGVLIEGARTNLYLRSNDFSTGWNLTNVTVTAAAATAPDGTLTAQKVEATTSAVTLINQNAANNATSSTFSIYVKQGSGATDANSFVLRNHTTSTNLLAITVNYSTGGITYGTGSSGAEMTALANGWWRLTMTATSGITSGDGIRCYPAFTGTSETAGEFCYLWGAQLEAAAFPSSYIPTVAASATRAADALSVTGVTGLDYPLSLFAETDLVTLAGGSVSQSYFQIDAGSNDRALLYGTNGGALGSRMYVASAGVQQALPTVGVLATGVRKTAGRVSTNSFRVAGNGTLATEDTSGSVPATPNTIRFGKESASGTELFGYLRRAAIWPRALTDGELTAVST